MFLILGEATSVSDVFIDPIIRRKIITSVVGLLAISLLRFGVTQVANQQIESPRLRYSVRKWLGYLFYGLYLLLLISLWLPAFDGLPTFLGLSAAGLAVVLRDPLVNVTGLAVHFMATAVSDGRSHSNQHPCRRL